MTPPAGSSTRTSPSPTWRSVVSRKRAPSSPRRSRGRSPSWTSTGCSTSSRSSRATPKGCGARWSGRRARLANRCSSSRRRGRGRRPGACARLARATPARSPWRSARGFDEQAAGFLANQAITEAVLGQSAKARENAQGALRASSGIFVAHGRVPRPRPGGDLESARTAIDDASKRFPVNTLYQKIAQPTARAAVELRRGEARRAIKLLEVAAPYELGGVVPYVAIYVRAQASQGMGRGQDAARGVPEGPGSSRDRRLLGASAAVAGSVSLAPRPRRATSLRAGARTRTSWRSGRTPTPTSRCCARRRRSTPSSRTEGPDPRASARAGDDRSGEGHVARRGRRRHACAARALPFATHQARASAGDH